MQALGCGIHLVASGCSILAAEQHGAAEVGGLHAVKIHQGEVPDAEQGEVLEHLIAQCSAAYYHHMRLLDAILPEPGQLGEYVIRVAHDVDQESVKNYQQLSKINKNL